jgi:transposase-like protein
MGARESAQDWRDLLLDLKRRGLDVRPELAIADGALGFWKAAGEVWPTTREQRRWVHKTANVHAKLRASRRPSVRCRGFGWPRRRLTPRLHSTASSRAAG